MTDDANLATEARVRARIDRHLSACGALVQVRSVEDGRDSSLIRDRADLAR